ncbi:MAG: PhzF family phenazine biosynthesis protein [Bauldia sp.]
MSRRYAVLDVFTDTPLAGNPLAVVLDSEGLTAETMQAIAAEFSLPETVFVLPAERAVHSARVRIFTPKTEMPFAGHPTIGTAVLLATERFGAAEQDGERDAMVILEEGIGPVRCGVRLTAKSAHAIFDAPRLPSEVAFAGDADAVAAGLGLARNEIGFENHRPCSFEAGLAFLFVPVRNLAAIRKALPQSPAFERIGQPVYLYTRETVSVGRQFHARMFGSGIGIHEDPATGSAAAALAGVIGRFDRPVHGTHRMVIEQGFEMGRPSLLFLEVDTGEGGAPSAVRVGGDAVVVARGTLAI